MRRYTNLGLRLRLRLPLPLLQNYSDCEITLIMLSLMMSFLIRTN